VFVDEADVEEPRRLVASPRSGIGSDDEEPEPRILERPEVSPEVAVVPEFVALEVAVVPEFVAEPVRLDTPEVAAVVIESPLAMPVRIDMTGPHSCEQRGPQQIEQQAMQAARRGAISLDVMSLATG